MGSAGCSMKKNKLDALLLQPPPGDLTGPYPALCYLKSFTAEKNFSVTVKDLGIEAFYYLSHGKRIQRLVQQATERLRKLELKGFLNHREQHHYHLLLSVMGVGLNRNLQDQVTAYFKKPKYFYEYLSYKKGCRSAGFCHSDFLRLNPRGDHHIPKSNESSERRANRIYLIFCLSRRRSLRSWGRFRSIC